MQQNPYLNLYTRLKTPWKDEKDNPQSKFMRMKLLEILTEIISVDYLLSDGNLSLSVLNFFTLMELVAVKIVFKKEKFTYFLEYFTKKRIFSDRIIDNGRVKYTEIEYFTRRMEKRSGKIVLTSKLLVKQFKNLVKYVIIKLERLKSFKRHKIIDELLLREHMRMSGLDKYQNWCIRVGKKFSNRYEVDFSEFYCLKQEQEYIIDKEMKKNLVHSSDRVKTT